MCNREFYNKLITECSALDEKYPSFLEIISGNAVLFLKGYGDTECMKIRLDKEFPSFFESIKRLIDEDNAYVI